jgi:phosphoribosylamine---glycine ligase
VRVLVIGSGGREHALAWSLAASRSLTELHAAPGNPGIAAHGTCHPVASDDAEGLLALARSLAVDLVVVGPEGPLVDGIGDLLRHSGIVVFGPGAAAARIEGSKHFAKDAMEAAGVFTARRLEAPVAPCVVKADGLAAGKGVVVCRNEDELAAGLETVRAYGGELVVEELLEGPEVSVLALCDGTTAVALPPAQDFKRAFDGDEGPNTGGMGSYAPVPGIDEAAVEEILETVHRPVLRELARRGTPFVGTLFAGLMLTPDGPRVLEFNCRFGDPETQSVLPLLDADLLDVLAAAASGDLSGAQLGVQDRAAVTIVLTAGSYPAGSDRGSAIDGVDAAVASDALVFHAGTALRDGRLVTNGGRILDVVAVRPTLAEARAAAYSAAALVAWDGVRCRSDIASAAAAGAILSLRL